MSEIKINNIPVITENNGSVSLTTGTATFTNLDVVGNIKETGGNIELHSNGYTGWKQTNYLGDFYIAHLTNGDAFKINSNGHVTMPYQPSFIGNHSDNYATTITSETKITFLSATVLNRGNCWDNANQRFVCPVAGVYHIFVVDITPSSTNKVGSLVIRLNGNEKIRGYSEERLKRVAVDLNCNVGDYIEFYTADGALQLYGDTYAQYSIKLIG